MGLFWNLIQQSQISTQYERARSLDSRVNDLEGQLYRTQKLLVDLLHTLENKFGEDLDGDGRVG